MALLDGQVQIRDLVMGPGTAYQIQSSTNFFARNVRADQSGSRAWNHGTWSGAEFMDQAVVPLRILVITDDDAAWLAKHQALAAAFAPVGETGSDTTLRFVFGAAEYVLFGRPRMVEPDMTLAATGMTFTQAAFVALDPRIYAGSETVVTMGLPTFTGGLTVPFTVPFTIDATQVGGIGTITNTGTAETGLLLRIDGPVPEPRVTLERPDGKTQILRLDLTLATGQWLDIDTAARTVLLNGTSNRRGQASGDFPTLPAGASTLRFAGGDFNATALLTARFRSAWW